MARYGQRLLQPALAHDASMSLRVRQLIVLLLPRGHCRIEIAAQHLGVSIATVRRWSNAGHLPGYRTPGGQRRFTVEELDAFVDSLQPRLRD